MLRGYPIGRFMAATAIGRFPRFFMYAWLGSALSVPTWALVVVIVGGAAVAIGLRLLKHQPILADSVVDGPGNTGASVPTPSSELAGKAPLRSSEESG